MHVGLEHQSCTWIMCDFSKTHLSRTKESCGYKESHAYLSHCMQFGHKPTALSHGHDSLSQPSLSSPCLVAWLQGGDLSLIWWATSRLLLEAERPFTNDRLLDKPVWVLPERQLDCVPHNFSLEWWHLSRFKIPYQRLRDPPYSRQRDPLLSADLQ